jgi:hypothetical protein
MCFQNVDPIEYFPDQISESRQDETQDHQDTALERDAKFGTIYLLIVTEN